MKGLIFGNGHYRYRVLEGWGTLPEAERLITETLVVVDWNEHYTDDHIDRIATAVRRVVA